MTHLYPSLISADLLNLQATIQALDPYCAGYHIDIMDNHFVPNLTWGPDFANAIDGATAHPSWVHLMVDDPKSIISKLNAKGGSTVTFHIETNGEKNILIEHIKEKKWRAGMAINPKTAITEIFPFLPHIDQILIMSVEPGRSGQQFIPSTMDKIKPLVEYRAAHHLQFTIAIDGGINQQNIGTLAAAGVQEFAVASAIFGNEDLVEAVKGLTQAFNPI